MNDSASAVTPEPMRRTERNSAWAGWWTRAVLPRIFRLGLLVAVAWLLYRSGRQPAVPDVVSIDAARTFFPTAAKFTTGDPRQNGLTVADEKGKPLGLLLTTSPLSDDLIGYSGPSNLLIALDAENKVLGVQVLSSGDTPSHVEQIRAERTYWQQFEGSSQGTHRENVAAVSGSTLTSLAFAEAVDRRVHGSAISLRFPEPVKLREIKKLFKSARKFNTDRPRIGWNEAFDAEGKLLGYVVRTSPHSDNVRGYQGPTESLIAVGPEGKTVVNMLIRKSYDTEEYLERVRPSDEFRDSLTGRTTEDWARIDFKQAGIEGVSGATQTSFAVAEGIRRRFAADLLVLEKKSPTWNWQPGLLAVIGGGLAVAFTPLKSNRRARFVWQAILIVAFLFWLGDLLSIALLVGWARHSVPWRTAPAVVLLGAVAIVVPWISRKQVYCQQLCPHGAAQSWLGQFKRLHLRISTTWQRRLGYFPALLLAATLLLAVFVVRFDLAALEPFDAWVLKTAAVVSAAIAVVGLIASLFVPFAYCRYGCPTGELLNLVKSGGPHDRLQRRDWLAAGLISMVACGLFGPEAWQQFAGEGTPPGTPVTAPPEPKYLELGGRAFGTTWSIKLRGDHELAPLQAAVAAELERIESTLSHWRPDSATSQFNGSETTLAMEQPEELLQLVTRAQELSKLTDGRYDITVAPLVDAWGYGPTGERAAPAEAELTQLLERVGWQKLTVDLESKTLRKKHPQLHIDLGSLLQGYAADRAGQILTAAGVKEYLIDVGGELLARGTWRVGIEDPRDPATPLRTFMLQDAALATSGVYRSKRDAAADQVHHLISPQTGRPFVTTAVLCAVAAPSAVEADGWATALLVTGLPEALSLADQQNLVVLILDQNQGVRSNALGEKSFAGK